MPTIVDELVVKLGLDSKAYKQGATQAEQDINRLRSTAVVRSREIAAAGDNAAQFFSKLRNEVIGVFAALASVTGLKAFISETTRAEAETGRLAHNIGMTTSALSAWEGAARRAGGTGSATASSFRGLVQQFQQFALTGHSAVIPYFRHLGIQVSDSEGHMRSLGAIMLDLADKFHAMSPERASAFGAAMGLDQGTINLLEQGRAKVQALLDEQRKLGVITGQQAAAGIRLQNSLLDLRQSVASLGREILTDLDPVLVKVIRGMEGWLQANHKWLAADIEGDVVSLGKVITHVVDDFPRWRREAELVAAYFAGPFAVAMLGGLGPIAELVGLILAGLMVYKSMSGSFDLPTMPTDSPLWKGIPRAEQMKYHNSPDWRAAHGLEDENPNKFSWWNPGSWLRGSSATDKAATVGNNLAAIVPGLSRHAAAGVASNAVAESSMNPGAVNATSGAYGLWQFLSMRQDYFQWARSHGMNPADYSAQVAYMGRYLRQHPDLVSKMNAAKTPQTAAAIFEREFERPGPGHMATHVAAARDIYSRMGGVPPDPSLVSGASASVSHTTNHNAPVSTTNNHDVSVGPITINVPSGDPKSIARGLRDELHKIGIANQANRGLN